MKQFLYCALLAGLLVQSNIASALQESMNLQGRFMEKKAAGKMIEHPFFKEHVLVFFFSSACPHCHSFAPVLKSYATSVNAHVLPLAIDNQPLPEFPQTLPATTEWIMVAFKGEPIHYPALFIANPKTHALYPVSVGALDANELIERMAALIPKIKAYESQGVLS